VKLGTSPLLRSFVKGAYNRVPHPIRAFCERVGNDAETLGGAVASALPTKGPRTIHAPQGVTSLFGTYRLTRFNSDLLFCICGVGGVILIGLLVHFVWKIF
jgi:hypothetical protein